MSRNRPVKRSMIRGCGKYGSYITAFYNHARRRRKSLLFKSRFKKLINLLHKLICPRLCLFISWKGWILKGSNLSIEWLRDITNFRAESSKARFSNNAGDFQPAVFNRY
uniref:Uncharacterized protein n=1 Tax=Rhizoctonia solani TaxID=456999 RepID=N0ACU2_9AGAM|nr:hypothetical protein RSOL_m00880 [Rhizoctonia solani]AGK45409.1 hypothetical protein RSOL_m00880 [Rhizoctonia solani]